MSIQKHIVTDMGGVLIDLYWIEAVKKALGKQYTLDELIQLWVNSKCTNEYETGKQKDFDEFIRQFIIEFNLKISPNDMKQYFMDVIGGPKEECFEIFEEFKNQGYVLSVFSNTNPIHVNFLTAKYDLFRLFDYKFFSHEIGYSKPQKQAYEYVINTLNVTPCEIYFFDDANINIKGALEVGINAFQVTSPKEIRNIVKKI